ncbi:M67 family metallopeptidase [Sphingomonas floccifaciens]|uniref:M67 family metallopeptidase n=2 Tax=Sphingomonas floccifaciens TaxID=1844115 RepID=A0ABW4NHN8_9SPHN
MGKSVEISSRILAEIAAEAASIEDREICGLLFGDDDRITAHIRCANVAAEPERRFEIDPAALIAAYRAERGGGARIIGCYHSHPSGDPAPSRTDAADAVTEGWIWLIAGGGPIRGWRVVAGGERHERFDPVDLRPIDAM